MYRSPTFWMTIFFMICFYLFRLLWSGNCPHSRSLFRLVAGSDQVVVVSSRVRRLQSCWIHDHLLSPARHDTECQMSQCNCSSGIDRTGGWRHRCLHPVLYNSSGGEELQWWRDHRQSFISNQLADMCRYNDSEKALAKLTLWKQLWKCWAVSYVNAVWR